MTHCLGDGIAGLLKEALILFRPIKTIVNFLTHLYNEGYQCSSINAYRYVISLVHEKIDGHDVG